MQRNPAAASPYPGLARARHATYPQPPPSQLILPFPFTACVLIKLWGVGVLTVLRVWASLEIFGQKDTAGTCISRAQAPRDKIGQGRGERRGGQGSPFSRPFCFHWEHLDRAHCNTRLCLMRGFFLTGLHQGLVILPGRSRRRLPVSLFALWQIWIRRQGVQFARLSLSHGYAQAFRFAHPAAAGTVSVFRIRILLLLLLLLAANFCRPFETSTSACLLSLCPPLPFLPSLPFSPLSLSLPPTT